jgi:uncharacterized phiE125 gp8 family phage protein
MSAPNIPQGDYTLALVTPPAAEPMSLTFAKLQLRIDESLTEEDDFINAAIAGARAYIEQAYDIKIMPQRWEMTLNNFPRAERIRFPVGPVQSIAYFTYEDTAGNVTTLTCGQSIAGGFDLLTRLARKPAELVLPFGHVWPAVVLTTADPIRIGLNLGWLTGASPETMPLPPQIRMAMGLLCDHFYNNRSELAVGLRNERIAFGVDALMMSLGFYRYN